MSNNNTNNYDTCYLFVIIKNNNNFKNIKFKQSHLFKIKTMSHFKITEKLNNFHIGF